MQQVGTFFALYSHWRWSATLRAYAQEPNEDAPPWARHNWSYAFSGLPPVEVYFRPDGEYA